jgi:hypothetical protein
MAYEFTAPFSDQYRARVCACSVSRTGPTRPSELATPICDVAAFPRAFRSSARMGYVWADQPYAALLHVLPCSATNLDASSGVLARNCNV